MAIIHNMTFESGAPDYNSDYTYPPDGHFISEQVIGQGWNGTNGHHFITLNGERQYNFGWASSIQPPSGWNDGDRVFVRIRLKYDSNFRWDGAGSMQNKMVDFGSDSLGGRVILHQESPHPTTGCGLDDSYKPHYGSLSVKRNIGAPCTPPVPITYDIWYHVQFEVQSGEDGYFKLWVNNNDYANPSSEVFGVRLTTAHWDDSWDIGGFTTDAPIRDQGWIVDDFQVATTFDPNWSGKMATKYYLVPFDTGNKDNTSPKYVPMMLSGGGRDKVQVVCSLRIGAKEYREDFF
ncbi:MAG: hypothetical protein ACW99U_20905, partial [Candidatus Thorarchaeota archaeon]